MAEPFYFHSETTLVKFTGVKADDLRALRDGIRTVSGSSIFYHVYYSLLREHFTTSENVNDFARWVIVVLGDEALGEKLACIDPLEFESVRATRDNLAEIIDSYMGETSNIARVPKEREFYFNEARSIVYSTGIAAGDLREFYEAVGRISIASLFFHFVESRLRLGRSQNDISLWIEESVGNKELAERILRLNPYFYNLWELREAIRNTIREYL